MKSRRLACAFLSIGAAGGILAITAGEALAHRAGTTPLRAPGCSAVQNPNGDLLLVSDLPLHGSQRGLALQMTKAIAFELARAGWKAGGKTIAYQSCDDSTAGAGQWSAAKCQSNATSYAANTSVVGVIGTLNSGCAELEIPILDKAPNGPLAMVSPANTYVGLTRGGPGTAAGEPGSYYPTGHRNYARLVAANDLQAAADAMLARQLHVGRLYVLEDGSAYGAGLATDVANAARKLGVDVVGYEQYDPRASSYESLAAGVRASGARAVFLGGLLGENGGRLVRDLRAAAPGVDILAPDGFTPISGAVEQSGAAAEGMFVSVAGLPLDRLPAGGQAFIRDFTAAEGPPDPFAAYAAQAADVMLAAIKRSNGTRAGVASALFGVKVRGGILGSVSFDPNGDPTPSPVTIYRIVKRAPTVYQVINPPPSLVPSS